MKIRIIGNSCSGKSTLGVAISSYLDIECLHMDGIHFVPNSNFVARESDVVIKDVLEFISDKSAWIIEGNYLSILSAVSLRPDVIIFINLPIEQSLSNYQNRFEKYRGKSRPELPNIIETDKQEMIEWIQDYPSRIPMLENYIESETALNPQLKVISITSMSKLCDVSNNLGKYL